jgi:hypothetical protein
MAKFAELIEAEVQLLRITLPRTPVNKGGFSSVWQKRAEMPGAPQHSGP